MSARTVATEFPDFDNAAAIASLPPGFTDVSWRNDACPSWQYKADESEFGPTVYINYIDPARREFSSACFALAYPEDGDTIELYSGDDLAACVKAVVDYYDSKASA